MASGRGLFGRCVRTPDFARTQLFSSLFGPLPGPETGLLSALGNELPEETHVLTEQETSLGRGARAESRRVREPRRTALPGGSQPWVLC